MTKFFLAVTLIGAAGLEAAAGSNAKIIMIHVVGINEIVPDANLPVFYQSAANFNKVCDRLGEEAECHLFMNTNPKYLTSMTLDTIPTIKNVDGLPTLAGLKNIIKNKLALAGSTLIMSFEDHGTPVDQRE